LCAHLTRASVRREEPENRLQGLAVRGLLLNCATSLRASPHADCCRFVEYTGFVVEDTDPLPSRPHRDPLVDAVVWNGSVFACRDKSHPHENDDDVPASAPGYRDLCSGFPCAICFVHGPSPSCRILAVGRTAFHVSRANEGGPFCPRDIDLLDYFRPLPIVCCMSGMSQYRNGCHSKPHVRLPRRAARLDRGGGTRHPPQHPINLDIGILQSCRAPEPSRPDFRLAAAALVGSLKRELFDKGWFLGVLQRRNRGPTCPSTVETLRLTEENPSQGPGPSKPVGRRKSHAPSTLRPEPVLGDTK